MGSTRCGVGGAAARCRCERLFQTQRHRCVVESGPGCWAEGHALWSLMVPRWHHCHGGHVWSRQTRRKLHHRLGSYPVWRDPMLQGHVSSSHRTLSGVRQMGATGSNRCIVLVVWSYCRLAALATAWAVAGAAAAVRPASPVPWPMPLSWQQGPAPAPRRAASPAPRLAAAGSAWSPGSRHAAFRAWRCRAARRGCVAVSALTAALAPRGAAGPAAPARSCAAVLIVKPSWVRRSAPSTTRGLSVNSVPCFFCLTNCP
jgi:hypothetical protein